MSLVEALAQSGFNFVPGNCSIGVRFMLGQALLDEDSFRIRQLPPVQPIASIQFPDFVKDFPPFIRAESREFGQDVCLAHADNFIRSRWFCAGPIWVLSKSGFGCGMKS
jgi:hypothetical protein